MTITGETDIDSDGIVNLAGADFGVASGTTTIVNNGSVDIEFLSLQSGENVLLSNGLTIAVEDTWINFGFAGGNSDIPGDFGAVLDGNLGIEEAEPTDADITLSGLTLGKQYQVQFFASDIRTDADQFDQTITSGGSVSGLLTPNDGTNGTFIVGTFTADAATQIFTVTGTGADGVGLANAFTVGEIAAAALPGDTDGDGDIDDADLGTAFSNYTGPVGAAGNKTAAQGDTDGDGDVDDSDLGTSFSNYTGPLGPAAVPEPTSLALLGLGGLAMIRRRRA